MKPNNYISLPFFILFICLSFSCNKDFLKPKPLSFLAPEETFQSEDGFESALVTVRRDLKSEFYGNWNPSVADASSTDLGAMYFAADWSGITPSTGTYLPILSLFGNIYGYIKNANLIISRIDDITWENEDKKNSILAQALFYRSYWYYRLVHTYGDIPWVGEEITGPKLDFQTYSKFNILKKIQKDLEFCKNNLPDSGPKYKPSKYAALQLLAKVYLDNLEFQKSIDVCTEIINGPFELMTNRFGSTKDETQRNVLWDLFRPENISIAENKETIFFLVSRDDAPDEAKAKAYTMRSYTPAWWHSNVRDSDGKHGTLDKNSDGSNTAQYDTLGRGNPDMTTDPWFNYEVWNDGVYSWRNTPDLRRIEGNWLNERDFIYNNPESVDYGKPIDYHNFNQLSDTLQFLFPIAWYKLFYPHPEGFTGDPMGGYGDRYVFRLGETYLIRAEAYYWKEEYDLSAKDINKIRERSHALPIQGSDITLDFIFDERARELFTEEMRHTELIRVSYILAQLNKDGYSLNNFSENNWYYDRLMSRNQFFALGSIGPNIFNFKTYNALWPIDNNVITANTLNTINQNEGYPGSENNVNPVDTDIP